MSEDEKELKKSDSDDPTLYAHLNSDGSIFLIPEDTAAGTWADIPRLKAELSRLEEVEGLFMYSVESSLSEPAEVIEQILELVSTYQVGIHYERYPHPAALMYHKSFAQYIYDAVDAAEMDVEGTKHLIEDIDQFLTTAESGTKEHREAADDKQRIETQLKEAEHALSRLREVELELCTHHEGREQ